MARRRDRTAAKRPLISTNAAIIKGSGVDRGLLTQQKTIDAHTRSSDADVAKPTSHLHAKQNVYSVLNCRP